MFFFLIALFVGRGGACSVPKYSLIRISFPAARTALSWWHDVHVRSGQPHDFSLMMAPIVPERPFRHYRGVVTQDVVRALVLCKEVEGEEGEGKREGGKTVLAEAFACHPGEREMAAILVRLVEEGDEMGFDWKALQDQPTWRMEAQMCRQRSERE